MMIVSLKYDLYHFLKQINHLWHYYSSINDALEVESLFLSNKKPPAEDRWFKSMKYYML